MDDPERRQRMGEIGRQRVENELAWQEVSKNLVNGYSRLLNGRLSAQPPETEMKAQSVIPETLEIRDS